MKYKIIQINDKNISTLKPLGIEALKDEHRFVNRAIDKWKSGENKFSKPGENFWGLFVEKKCIAIGGLVTDNYIKKNNGTIGRVKHVYVAKKYRGLGLSKIIMKLILDEAEKNFKFLRLSATDSIAFHLYESLGFKENYNEKLEQSFCKNPDRKFYILNLSTNFKKNNWDQVEKILKEEKIGVLPTDTIYGLVGSALSKKAVERIYKIKKRDRKKPLIVLISSYKDLDIFGIKFDKKLIWPYKTSIILSCLDKKFRYLHRGENSIAFRMITVKNKNLLNLIKKTGPLVAPSANPEGKKPAETIAQAKNYFDKKIDFYIDGGLKKSKPSTLITYIDDKKIVLRK